jgi:hypothetical protein
MDTLQAFQAVAHENGFVDLEASEDGTVLWLRRTAEHGSSKTHQRICLDTITNSATVYWKSGPEKIDSKTFRTASELREWFALAPVP